MRPMQPRPVFKQVIPPILFSDLVSKVVITPDTPVGMIADLEKSGITAETLVSPRKWAPNPHMDAYNRRRDMKKR